MPTTFGYAIVYVPEVEKALAFYEAAFGFERTLLHESGDFGQLATGSTSLAFTSHRLGATAVPVEYRPVNPAEAVVGVEFTLLSTDVDAAFAHAVSVGAVPLSEPHDEVWGQRVSYVRDPFGMLVGIASPM